MDFGIEFSIGQLTLIRTNENISFINSSQQPISGSVTVNKGLMPVAAQKHNKIIPTFLVFKIVVSITYTQYWQDCIMGLIVTLAPLCQGNTDIWQ